MSSHQGMLLINRVVYAGLFVAILLAAVPVLQAQDDESQSEQADSSQSDANESGETGESVPETAADNLAATEFFESKVRPVLIRSCVECHGETMQRGNLRLDSTAAFSQGGDSGPLIQRDDLPSSLILEVLTHESDLKMPPPPKAKLSEVEMADIRTWVEMGAVWPPNMEKSASQLAKEAKWAEHWAFQPIREQAIPQVKSRDHAKSPIDAFIVAKLEGAGLTPSPAADRTTLFRRLSYNLHGLPPSDEDVQAINSDRSSQWFENAVDRLLRSPRYGERWGRFWLDFARYSDVRGNLNGNVQRLPFAWSYRDWVVDAFNRDLPYDRFLMLQIAADHVPSTDEASDVRDLAALGFLTLNKLVPDVGEPAEIDDRLDTLFRTTMGLSVSCARCHDHKYDPIPTADYYSLYGVFQGATQQDVPIVASTRDQFALRRYEEELQRLSSPIDELLNSHIERLTADARAKFSRLFLATKVATMEFDGDERMQFLIERFREWTDDGGDAFDPVWTPWRELGGLSEEEFKKQAGKLARKYKSNKFEEPDQKLNKRVVAMFSTVPKSQADLADRYAKMFLKVDKAWSDLVAESEKNGSGFPEKLPDDADNALRELIEKDSSPLAISLERIKTDVDPILDDATTAAVRALMEHVDAWKSSPSAPRHAMVLKDPENIEAAYIFIGGTPFNNGAEVPRRFLTYFAGPEAKPFENGTGRYELAQAIASEKNPLAARVIVNRVWMQHFGEGLVATPSDFGVRCETPSHPELLDYLAHRFMAEGWSIKKLHRWILTSHTWQQSSRSNERGMAVDPENRLLWRANRRRLDFESMRDSLLSVSGELELKSGGPSQPLFGLNPTLRRAVYGHVDRDEIPEPMRAFDFANPNMHSPRRHETIVAQQSLFLLNSSFVADRGRNLVARLGLPASEQNGIDRIFQSILRRSPDSSERAAVTEFLSAATTARSDAGIDEFNAWSYGRGEYDESTKRMVAFAPLGYFQQNESLYRAGPLFPDPRLGYINVNSRGGHPGMARNQAVIRRWTAPRSGKVDITGELSLESDGSEGILGVIAVRQAAVASWKLASVDSDNPLPRNADTPAKSIAVKAGDTIDFIVDPLADADNDGFFWPVHITYQDANAGRAKTGWSSETDFTGPPGDGSLPLTSWEQLAQVLMLSNEFLFVD